MDQLIIYIFVAALSILLIVLMYVYVLYEKEMKIRRHQERILADAQDVLDKARTRAHGIVEKAVEKGEKTILKTDYFRSDLIASLERSLQEMVGVLGSTLKVDQKQFEKDYEKLYETIRAEYIQRVDETLTKLETVADQEMKEFKTILREETMGSETALRQKVLEEFDKTKKEIADYKVKREGELEESVKAVVKQASYEVMGKSLSQKDHEKLVKDALERAKQDNLFS